MSPRIKFSLIKFAPALLLFCSSAAAQSVGESKVLFSSPARELSELKTVGNRMHFYAKFSATQHDGYFYKPGDSGATVARSKNKRSLEKYFGRVNGVDLYQCYKSKKSSAEGCFIDAAGHVTAKSLFYSERNNAVNAGNYLYFSANVLGNLKKKNHLRGDQNLEIFRTDGSVKGTQVVSNLHLPFSNPPYELTPVGKHLLFKATTEFLSQPHPANSSYLSAKGGLFITSGPGTTKQLIGWNEGNYDVPDVRVRILKSFVNSDGRTLAVLQVENDLKILDPDSGTFIYSVPLNGVEFFSEPGQIANGSFLFSATGSEADSQRLGLYRYSEGRITKVSEFSQDHGGTAVGSPVKVSSGHTESFKSA